MELISFKRKPQIPLYAAQKRTKHRLACTQSKHDKLCNATYLQKYSPLGVDRQVPPFLHGDGEQDTKPEKDKLSYEKVIQIKIYGISDSEPKNVNGYMLAEEVVKYKDYKRTGKLKSIARL